MSVPGQEVSEFMNGKYKCIMVGSECIETLQSNQLLC